MLLHCLSAKHVRKMHGLVTFGRLKCISGCHRGYSSLSDSSLLLELEYSCFRHNYRKTKGVKSTDVHDGGK